MTNELTKYLTALHPIHDPLLLKMKQYAEIHRIPIMEDTSMEVLLSLIRMKRPNRILEIGTAIGYSAIRMAKASDNCTIVTCDHDEERLSVAKSFIDESGLQERISLLNGDAFVLLPDIRDRAPYDVIFIDAAKGQYKNYFQSFSPFLSNDGIIISDNVFFRGWVPKMPESLPKRYRTLIEKLREYNQFLTTQENFHTTFYPVGDGIAVSLKIK